jgi:arylsulfatase
METVDEEFITASFAFMDKAKDEDKPFFVWINTTRMHVFTHVPQKYLDAAKVFTSGTDVHCAGMLQHDEHVGMILRKLEETGEAENTIVIYSTDNGAEVMTWPDGGATPFRGEKATNWEGGFRVPMVIRWPGVIKPGTVDDEICAHEDLIPTSLAAAGDPDIVEKCRKGHKVGKRTYKVHLDGVNLLPALQADTPPDPWPRRLFPYWSDDGDFLAIRPSTCSSFREFPPRMKAGSFNLDRVMDQVTGQPGKN